MLAPLILSNLPQAEPGRPDRKIKPARAFSVAQQTLVVC